MRFSSIFLSIVFIFASSAHSAEPSFDACLEQHNKGLSRFVLDNGMICLVKEDHTAPIVAIQIWVGTGSIHEEEYLGGGLSHVIEHMIFKGTPTRKPGDISKAISDAGGSINAYTSLDRTVFLVDIPDEHWRTGLTVLADAVMHASFPKDELEREKKVILREMAMTRDNPERELTRLMLRTAFRVHPYRFPVIGYKDVFNTITQSDVMAFFRRHYTPDNMIVVIVGDIKLPDVRTALRETFSGFSRRARAPVILPREPRQIAPRFAQKTGPYHVSRLEWAYHTVALTHPDAPGLDILAKIVGNGRSSRLVQNIKEKKKLAQQIDAWSYTPKSQGLFGINATFDQKNEKPLINAIESEIDRWISDPPELKEIEKARRLLITSILSAYQTMHGQADNFAAGEFYAGNPFFSRIMIQRLEAVTPESVVKIARRYCRKENRTLVMLSPESEKEEPLGISPENTIQNIQKIVLPNGIPLLIKENHRLPFVHFCVAFCGGLLFENETHNGITSLMAELMTRGTKKQSSRDIADTVESLGGSLSSFSGHNSFGLRAQCFSQDFKTFFNLIADCLLIPAFSIEEINKQKTVQLATIAKQQELPFFLAMKTIRQMLFPGSPYRFSPEGTKKSVEAISRDVILSYFRKNVVSGNIVISIFGDITPDQVVSLAENKLNRFPAGLRPAFEYEIQKPDLPKVMKSTEPMKQTIVLVGFPGITIKDPRMDALTVMANAMSGLSSDMVIAIRDTRGLVYYAGAFQKPGVEPGSFIIYAGTRKQAVDEVLELIQQDITRVTTQGIREDEFKRAKQKIITRYHQNLQMDGEMAMECALNELYGLGYEYSFSTEERLNALTLSSIREAVSSILVSGKTAISIVLPECEE